MDPWAFQGWQGPPAKRFVIFLSQCVLGPGSSNIHMLVIIIFQQGEAGLRGQKGPPGSQGPFVSN